MPELPDLWDEDMVNEWLRKEIEEALLELIMREPVRYDEAGKQRVAEVIAGVYNPYGD